VATKQLFGSFEEWFGNLFMQRNYSAGFPSYRTLLRRQLIDADHLIVEHV